MVGMGDGSSFDGPLGRPLKDLKGPPQLCPPHFPTSVFSRERGGSSFGSRSNDLRGGDQSEEPDRPVGKGSDEKGHRPPHERKRGRHGLG